MDVDVMAWINVYINSNCIKAETDKAILVKEPKTDWLMWISKKSVRDGTHPANLSVGFNEEFEYRIFRNGNGKYNRREVLEETTISGVEAAQRWAAK